MQNKKNLTVVARFENCIQCLIFEFLKLKTSENFVCATIWIMCWLKYISVFWSNMVYLNIRTKCFQFREVCCACRDIHPIKNLDFIVSISCLNFIKLRILTVHSNVIKLSLIAKQLFSSLFHNYLLICKFIFIFYFTKMLSLDGNTGKILVKRKDEVL